MSRDADHYAVLGVVPGTQDVVIEAAYRALMQRYEADRSVNAAKKRSDVEAAFGILGDPKSRAAYDKKRGYAPVSAEQVSVTRSTSAPVAQTANSADAASVAKPKRGLVPALWVFGIIALLFVIIASAPESSTVAANNIMNVDENLATTDMNAGVAATDTDMNATDMNATAAESNATEESLGSEQTAPADLSTQVQLPLAFENIESASKWSASTLRSGGFTGARSTSEQCHSSVHDSPSWAGADRCAAFDYAAAYIDDLLARDGRASTHAYFQFARENQADNYTSIGAAAYSLPGRLAEIRRTAETTINETLAAAAARERAANPAPTQQVQPSSPAQPSTAPATPARIRAVPQGVFLNSETNLGDGTKRCRFDNGTERIIPFNADCFYR